ncbi:MAG: GNAT family N-acetyltransferase [Bryobacteraceae bacterium]
MIEVRALTTHEQFGDAVDLQREVWGFADIELLPVRLFVVATKIGGQAFGAYDGASMVGFCLAIPGLKAGGRSYLHSHMLGVREGYRNRRVGRMLKLAQRDDARERGIDLIEWTFDPLELKNAFLNIERLGAVVRRYVPNQYGITSSSLHGGLPTDRCVAEWWIESPRAKTISSGGEFARPPVEARVEVPAEIAKLRIDEPARAREIQRRVSDAFMSHFARGLAVTGFERADHAGAYLFGKWEFK